jgi:hypothetical protein
MLRLRVSVVLLFAAVGSSNASPEREGQIDALPDFANGAKSVNKLFERLAHMETAFGNRLEALETGVKGITSGIKNTAGGERIEQLLARLEKLEKAEHGRSDLKEELEKLEGHQKSTDVVLQELTDNSHDSMGLLSKLVGQGGEDGVKLPHGQLEIPKFYMYEDAGWISNEDLLDCWDKVNGGKMPWLQEKEHAQNSGDIWIYYALKDHPSRTKDPAEATLIYVPYLVRISNLLGDNECKGTTAEERDATFVQALNASKIYQKNMGSDHLFVCQSWECYDYLQKIKASAQMNNKDSILLNGYLAVHENNPRWTQRWNQSRVIVIPYNANTNLLKATASLTLQDVQQEQIDFNIFFASGHPSGNAVKWANCNRSHYNYLNQYPDNVAIVNEPDCFPDPDNQDVVDKDFCCIGQECRNEKAKKLLRDHRDPFESYAEVRWLILCCAT